MSQVRLATEHKNGNKLDNKVYDISEEQDQHIAGIKLTTLGYSIDKLTPEQIEYMDDYAAGT